MQEWAWPHVSGGDQPGWRSVNHLLSVVTSRDQHLFARLRVWKKPLDGWMFKQLHQRRGCSLSHIIVGECKVHVSDEKNGSTRTHTQTQGRTHGREWLTNEISVAIMREKENAIKTTHFTSLSVFKSEWEKQTGVRILSWNF